MAIEFPILVCAQPLPGSLRVAEVAQAVSNGLLSAGRPRPDVLELPATGDASALLNAAGFDARMRAAFAVVVVTEHLREGDLRGTIAAEIATRSRQAGVACHAICAEDSLEAFSARIYDLQTIRTAISPQELGAAARSLSAEL